MTEDRIARMMALDAAQQGGTGDAYTKAETDELLDGKADLENGKVPASQLPSYVDDVLEYSSTSSFPATGESGKIYVATDTNKTYRWGGSAYVEISESLALGETASTAYAGDKGKANADAIAKKPGEITTGKEYNISGQTVTAGTGAEAFNDLANNKAAGQYSHAEGQNTAASGALSHAEGNSTTASGAQSHAEGGGTRASGAQSHAEGSGTTASGANSHAENAGATASGTNSHAEGAGTTASAPQSHAEGNSTKASSANQHVQGKYNVEDSNSNYAFIIGNGTGNNARHNAFAIDWNGLVYVNGAATGVDVSALYTKSEVDTALAAKLNTADVDDALSDTSTNPVQNKVVQAPVARLVDAGAKNLLKVTATSQTINGVTFTVNEDQTVTVNGTNTGTGSATFILVPNRQAILIPDGDYWFSGCPQGGNSNFDLRWYRYSPNASAYDTGSGAAIHKSGNTTDSNIAIVVKPGVTVNNITFKPMLCTAEDYAISPEFVPYAPSNRELYEMILALHNSQNGG